MAKKYIFLLLFILILGLFKERQSLFCSEKNGLSGVKMILATEKTCFIIGEPMKIIITIENVTNVPIKIWRGYEINIYILEEGKYQKYRWRENEILEKRFPAGQGWQELFPGEKIYVESFILYRVLTKNGSFLDGYAFSEPGKYKVKAVAEHLISKTMIESNEVEIEIKNPEKKNDLLVWELIKTSEFAKFIHFGKYWDTRNPAETRKRINEIIEVLKTIIEQYPTSTYTPYIKEALIKYYKSKPDKTSEEKEYLQKVEGKIVR